MSLHDAIIALSPLHYWPFATASGDLSASDVVGGLTFSSAVNDGGGITGPEMGTTAQRLFSDQIWTTAALNANAFVSSTWMALVSIPAIGGINSFVDWMGWGDPSNRTARGFRVSYDSSGVNTAQFRLIGSVNSVASSAYPYPQNGWHLLWWTIQPSISDMQLTIDGGVTQRAFAMPGTAPINSDQLWIQSSVPITIAHVAAFNVVLNPTQVGTIVSQIVNWPTQIPINMPLTTPSTAVDLTPVLTQTTQILNNQAVAMPQISNTQTIVETTQPVITQTQTDTHNIVNTLFPQLSDFLNTIMNGITTTITGVGGAVSKTIGQLFSGQTLDLLTTQDLGTVCAPDVLDVTLSGGVFFGIQAEATTWADWYVFTGPGDTYVTQSLGTLEITRGGSLELRVGLHTTTHTVYPLPGAPNFALDLGLPNVPLDYHVSIVPAPETCWHLVGLTMP